MKIAFLIAFSIASGVVGLFAAFILLGAGICGEVPAAGGAIITVICGTVVVGISQFFGDMNLVPSVFYCLPVTAMAALAVDWEHKLAAAGSAIVVGGVAASIFLVRSRMRPKPEPDLDQNEKGPNQSPEPTAPSGRGSS